LDVATDSTRNGLPAGKTHTADIPQVYSAIFSCVVVWIAILSPVSAAEPRTAAQTARILSLLSTAASPIDSDKKAAIEFYSRANQQLLWVRGERIDERGRAVIVELSNADDYGLRATDYDLPSSENHIGDQSLTDWIAEAEVKISLAVLKYCRDARGGRVDPNRFPKIDVTPATSDPLEILEAIAVNSDPADYLRSFHPHHPQFEALRRKLAEDNSNKANILLNMERWRWLPELNPFHVLVNVPAFTLKVFNHGKVLMTSKVVAGLENKQTPILNGEIDEIVFNPTWVVPNSIVEEEVLPYVAWFGMGWTTSIFTYADLHVALNGREVDPSSINWGFVDIGKINIFQLPGGSNPLGTVKFHFPNRYSVFLHGTPHKDSFERDMRLESHGCIRVEAATELATLLLKHDQNWSNSLTSKTLVSGNDRRVKLVRTISVYIAYFTLWVNDDGTISNFGDVYGRDDRMASALGLKPTNSNEANWPRPIREDSGAADTPATWPPRLFP
jgi:L,D-transpeptidase YcbB